jgi:hypothetical protein
MLERNFAAGYPLLPMDLDPSIYNLNDGRPRTAFEMRLLAMTRTPKPARFAFFSFRKLRSFLACGVVLGLVIYGFQPTPPPKPIELSWIETIWSKACSIWPWKEPEPEPELGLVATIWTKARFLWAYVGA